MHESDATPGLPIGLILALAVTALARTLLPLVVYWIHRDSLAFFTPDGVQYLDLARSLATSGAYQTAEGIELIRVPGYPSMVAVGVWLGYPVAVTIALQLFLGLLTTGLCYATARDLAGERAGTAAALVYASEPGQWLWSSLMLSETLFVALVAATLWFAVWYERSSRLWLLLMAIPLACMSAYVRIVGYVLPFALALWFAAGRRRDRKARGHVVIAVGLTCVLLGAWHVRNGLASGYWGFSSQFERAAYYAAGASAEARRLGISYPEARRRLGQNLQVNPGPAAGAASLVAEMRSRGIGLIMNEPISFAASYVTGILVTLAHPDAGTVVALFDGSLLDVRSEADTSGANALVQARWRLAGQRLRDRGAAYWLVGFGQMLLVGMCYYLAIRSLRGSIAPRAVWLVVLPAVCILMLSGGPHAQGRFRAPLVPSLSILAGIGYASTGRRHMDLVRPGEGEPENPLRSGPRK